jgi:hypothetical protein
VAALSARGEPSSAARVTGATSVETVTLLPFASRGIVASGVAAVTTASTGNESTTVRPSRTP